MVVVGASITAGVGARQVADAWPYLLARRLQWQAVVAGVPGAGYLRRGWHQSGPIRRELADIHLSRLHPALVIVQAGHDDIGVPRAVEHREVAALVHHVNRVAPDARIVLITVFPGKVVTTATRRTNHTIVDAARAADSSVLVLDPLTGHWRYPTIADHLHPNQAGERWIATRVARSLIHAGIARQPTSAGPGRGPDLRSTASSTSAAAGGASVRISRSCAALPAI